MKIDINQLLKGVDCACGRHHSCDISYVYAEKDACRHLPEIIPSDVGVLLVADENTYAADGRQVELAMGAQIRKRVIFDGSRVLIPDEAAVGAVFDALSSEISMIVGVGSGVIQDICKYCAFERSLKYVIVATAPSMDGYASSGAAMIMGGMKVTYPAAVPYAILADIDVLCKAPMAMLQAGYGDIIGKFSSLSDWKLSAVVNDEYLCPYIYDATMDVARSIRAYAGDIRERKADAIEELMRALLLVGIYMSFAGNSRPASGSEHHLSHFYEITGILRSEPYFAHGLDVAYSSVETAVIRKKLLEKPFGGEVFRLPQEEYRKALSRVYGRIADQCQELQRKNYAAVRPYLEREEEIKAVLREAPTPEETLEMLADIGLDPKEYNEMYSAQKRHQAVFYAKELKDRYTVLCLYYDFFGRESLDI